MDYHYNKTSATAAAVSGGVDLAMVGASILGKAAKAIGGASKAEKGVQVAAGVSKTGKEIVQSEVGTVGKLFEGGKAIEPAAKKDLGGLIEAYSTNAGKPCKTIEYAEHQAYKAQLAFEEAGILTKDSKITNEYAKKILTTKTDDPTKPFGLKYAIKEGEKLNNQKVQSTLERSGKSVDSLENWFKFTTESVTCPSGAKRQVHGYMNRITGEINYNIDFKIKGGDPKVSRLFFSEEL
jgi:hypothetical protein